jgi:hypothetical protein
MINIYEVIFISMKYILNPSQISKLKNFVQSFINSELETIKNESDDWGLGEMDELDEINSVDKIVVDRIVPYTQIKVYVKIYRNSEREEFDNLMSELRYRLQQNIPNSNILIDEIM